MFIHWIVPSSTLKFPYQMIVIFSSPWEFRGVSDVFPKFFHRILGTPVVPGVPPSHRSPSEHRDQFSTETGRRLWYARHTTCVRIHDAQRDGQRTLEKTWEDDETCGKYVGKYIGKYINIYVKLCEHMT